MTKNDNYGKPVLDKKVLDSLNELMGGNEQVIEVLEIYILETPPQMEILKASIVDDDEGITRKIAHSLRGSSMAIGANIVAELFRDIDSSQSDLDGKEKLEKVDEIYTELEKIRSLIQELKL